MKTILEQGNIKGKCFSNNVHFPCISMDMPQQTKQLYRLWECFMNQQGEQNWISIDTTGYTDQVYIVVQACLVVGRSVDHYTNVYIILHLFVSVYSS